MAWRAVECARGADLARKDRQWQGTAVDWARHGGHAGLEEWLGGKRSELRQGRAQSQSGVTNMLATMQAAEDVCRRAALFVERAQVVSPIFTLDAAFLLDGRHCIRPLLFKAPSAQRSHECRGIATTGKPVFLLPRYKNPGVRNATSSMTDRGTVDDLEYPPTPAASVNSTSNLT